MNRLDPVVVRARLQRAGIWSKHRLGQHFLVDATVLDAVVAAGELRPGNTVVEVGPGMGVLTEVLLQRTDRVWAFEFDADMRAVLQEDFAVEITAGHLRLVAGDALQTIPAAGLPEKYMVVANIPYQITTPLLELFLEREHKPARLSLLVQREVAERLAAPAGKAERGFLSVLCQYFADVRLVQVVPPQAFEPAPAVDSAVLQLVVRPQRPFNGVEERAFLRFVKSGFQQRRKQLRNVLAGVRGTTPAAVGEVFAELGLPAHARAQELSEQQWMSLFKSGI